MSPNKRASEKANKSSAAQRRRSGRKVLVLTDDIGLMLVEEDDSNSHRSKQPYRINPESDVEREKRLAARKALTLKAARIAYENHHRRKTS